MNSEISENVQMAITPGEVQDLYYPGKTNTEVQAFPSTMENRFYAGLNNPAFGGSSTILFNPAEGVSDIVLNLQLPVAAAPATYANWALGKSWGAKAIRQIGFRVGGSSLYYITGDQMWVDTLDDCEDQAKKNAIVTLAGAECLTPADFADQRKLSAYVYIKLPWNTISSLQKVLPLSSDNLTQPIQIIVEFYPYTHIFFPLAGALASALPSGFSYAQMNFRQVHLTDSSHILSRRVNMNENCLTLPLRGFLQTAFKTTAVVANPDLPVQINLTGFRQSSLKDITLWAVKASDIVQGQDLTFQPLLDVQLSVNGLIYYQTVAESAQIWSLCDRKTPTAVSTTTLSDAGGGNAAATPYSASWVVVPFAQVVQPLAGESDVALGLSVQNSVVNLSLRLPTADTYVITASYKSVASLALSRGTAEYIF
jgi:hypothetical protein